MLCLHNFIQLYAVFKRIKCVDVPMKCRCSCSVEPMFWGIDTTPDLGTTLIEKSFPYYKTYSYPLYIKFTCLINAKKLEF